MNRRLLSDLLLLLASLIWGFAFVAQRKGMETIGPFLFNGIRFAIGGLVLVPWILRRRVFIADVESPVISGKTGWMILPGFLLFGGASLQQMGIVYTTAGKAGFITGLYVILVPLLGLFAGKKTHRLTWMGAILAVIGLYFLSVQEDLTMGKGEFLVLLGSFFWAFHVLLISVVVHKMDSLWIAFIQFEICSLLSLIVAFVTEPVSMAAVLGTAIPILYAGILSSGVAYTLQVVAQRHAHPSHAAIILSLESPFAALGGWLMLKEQLLSREVLGALLMFAGMLLSQIAPRNERNDELEHHR